MGAPRGTSAAPPRGAGGGLGGVGGGGAPAAGRPDFPLEAGTTAVGFPAAGAPPPRRLPPIRVGVYYATYPISDPGHLPSPAWLFRPRPEVVAPYDFSVLQTQGEGAGRTPTGEFCARVKQINPRHRIILRLNPIAGAIPKYAAESFYRRGLIEYYADLIKNAGPENVYAVTIGEEENGNFTGGLWWRDTPPDWIAAYRQPFERETRRPLTWINAVCGNDNFLEWLKPKIRFFYNDVYDQIKARFPGLKVLQYIAVAGDGSGIAWHEPGEIRADGWVYWGFHQKKAPVLVDCHIPGAAEPAPVCVVADSMFQGLMRIRRSGVPNAEIYHCGFAHEPEGKYYDPVEQIRMLQEMGVANAFHFYPTGAFLQPEDCADQAKAGEIDRDPYRMWRVRRHQVLEYRKQIGPPAGT